MIKFVLQDENDNKSYELFLNFSSSDEYLDFIDEDEDYENFMESMECGNNPWNGVHDYNSSEDDEKIEYVGYTSYEIKDFPAALQKWKEFFQKKNKLRLS